MASLLVKCSITSKIDIYVSKVRLNNLELCLDCKTVIFFANASDGVGPSSNERSRASVKMARENGERRGRVRLARHSRITLRLARHWRITLMALRAFQTTENDCFAV